MEEKVATGTPNGAVSISSDVFEESIIDEEYRIRFTKNKRKKLEASLRLADICMEHNQYRTAFHYFLYVLEESLLDGKIAKGYYGIARRAYQGLVGLQSCEDERVWEGSSQTLEDYRHLFQKKTL